jgi:hypothetical protein
MSQNFLSSSQSSSSKDFFQIIDGQLVLSDPYIDSFASPSNYSTNEPIHLDLSVSSALITDSEYLEDTNTRSDFNNFGGSNSSSFSYRAVSRSHSSPVSIVFFC